MDRNYAQINKALLNYKNMKFENYAMGKIVPINATKIITSDEMFQKINKLEKRKVSIVNFHAVYLMLNLAIYQES